MERHRFGNTDLTVSAIGLGCYGMSGVYGPADDAESIATIRRSVDLGVNIGQLRPGPQSPLDRLSNPGPQT
jgi:pyridoxine 4-dehydrogenase